MTDSNRSIIFPEPLKPGSLIAICSPAGPVNPDKVYKAAEVLEAHGWRVRIMPHALGTYGNYAGTDAERLADLEAALTDPEVRAILCSRGGYGVVHILDQLDDLNLRKDPKWIIGYSDISALHALATRHGIASIHASMAAHIMLGDEDPDNKALFQILEGGSPVFTFPAAPHFDRPGIATGRLVGGNLAVLAELIGTRFDVFAPDTILFIEDIAEPIYKIERIMYQLRFAGILPRLAGLIVGQFTEYDRDKSYRSMEEMIYNMVSPYTYPVAFDAPIGHVEHNIPLIENAMVTLKVTNTATNSLIFWS